MRHRVRVFVSSPSDVEEEKAVLAEVVQRINRTEDVALELTMWETGVVPRIGPGPQHVVDRQIPTYDVYLGIMSARFGGDDQRKSGTWQEFSQAFDRWSEWGEPWILFYFDDAVDAPRTPEEHNEYGKVVNFRDSCQKLGIIGTYEGVRGSKRAFMEQVEEHLRRVLTLLDSRADDDDENVRVPACAKLRKDLGGIVRPGAEPRGRIIGLARALTRACVVGCIATMLFGLTLVVASGFDQGLVMALTVVLVALTASVVSLK